MSLTTAALLFTSVFAGEGSFNYVDLNAWTGVCNEGMLAGSIQQSPISIPSAPVLEGAVEMTFTDLVGGELKLFQDLQDHDGQLSMILKSDVEKTEPLASFNYKEKTFNLDHIHSHWGSSEHLIDGQGADGNFHLVFKADDGEISVIEVKVQFTSEDGPDVMTHFPRCPALTPDQMEHNHHSAGCALHGHGHSIASGEPADHHEGDGHGHDHDHHSGDDTHDGDSPTILEALGVTEEVISEMVNYMGSLTTPPCSTGLNWFVIPRPVLVHDPQGDMLGCDSFQSAFPHADHDHDINGLMMTTTDEPAPLAPTDEPTPAPANVPLPLTIPRQSPAPTDGDASVEPLAPAEDEEPMDGNVPPTDNDASDEPAPFADPAAPADEIPAEPADDVPADETPADDEPVVPADETPAAPADDEPVVPADETPAPADDKPVVPADSDAGERRRLQVTSTPTDVMTCSAGGNFRPPQLVQSATTFNSVTAKDWNIKSRSVKSSALAMMSVTLVAISIVAMF